MARKKANGTQGVGNRVSASDGKLQWLNVRLEEEDIATVLALSDSTDEFRNELVSLVAGGGNFSVRFNPDKGDYSCFVSDSRGESDGNRYGISSSAIEARHAISAAIIKLRLWKSSPDRFTQAGSGLGIR